jgi:hypothetical protein
MPASAEDIRFMIAAKNIATIPATPPSPHIRSIQSRAPYPPYSRKARTHLQKCYSNRSIQSNNVGA